MKQLGYAKFVLGLLLALVMGQASAQDNYPSRAIHLVAANPPGASLDIMARVIGRYLNEELKQPVVVENRPGASTMLGAGYVARADADGYVLMLTSMSYATSAAIYSNLTFDPINDLVGVTMVSKGPWLLVVTPSLPVQSVQDLIDYAKAHPGTLNYASAGNGTVNNLWMEQFKSDTKTDIVQIPYKGANPAILDVMSGRSQIFLGSLPSVWGKVKAGQLRALAITSPKRSALVPELPTVAEATGIKGLELEQWWGIFAPAKTPKSIVDKLNAATHRGLVTEEIKTWLANQGAEPAPTTPEEFTADFRADIARWQKVVAQGGLQIEEFK